MPVTKPIKLSELLYLSENDSWDDFDIDKTTGALVRKTPITKLQAEKPDDELGGPLGKYIFGDLRREILMQNIDPEPDTELEKALLSSLISYVSSNDKSGLDKIAPELLKLHKVGKYKSHFSVTTPRVWRVLIGLSKEKLEKLINSPVGDKKTGVLSEPITLQPAPGTMISGWTTDASVLSRIYAQATAIESTSNQAGSYVAVMACNPAMNDFFFSLDSVKKYLAATGNPYSYQKEVLAYGPVESEMLTWKLVANATLNPVSGMVRYMETHLTT